MTKEQDLPVFPVAGWELGPVPRLKAVILRLHYLSTPADRPEEANRGIRHAMTPFQARELAREILEAARQAESGAPPSGQSPTD